jgi:hypothetical protein
MATYKILYVDSTHVVGKTETYNSTGANTFEWDTSNYTGHHSPHSAHPTYHVYKVAFTTQNVDNNVSLYGTLYVDSINRGSVEFEYRSHTLFTWRSEYAELYYGLQLRFQHNNAQQIGGYFTFTIYYGDLLGANDIKWGASNVYKVDFLNGSTNVVYQEQIPTPTIELISKDHESIYWRYTNTDGEISGNLYIRIGSNSYINKGSISPTGYIVHEFTGLSSTTSYTTNAYITGAPKETSAVGSDTQTTESALAVIFTPSTDDHIIDDYTTTSNAASASCTGTQTLYAVIADYELGYFELEWAGDCSGYLYINGYGYVNQTHTITNGDDLQFRISCDYTLGMYTSIVIKDTNSSGDQLYYIDMETA